MPMTDLTLEAQAIDEAVRTWWWESTDPSRGPCEAAPPQDTSLPPTVGWCRQEKESP